MGGAPGSAGGAAGQWAGPGAGGQAGPGGRVFRPARSSASGAHYWMTKSRPWAPCPTPNPPPTAVPLTPSCPRGAGGPLARVTRGRAWPFLPAPRGVSSRLVRRPKLAFPDPGVEATLRLPDSHPACLPGGVSEVKSWAGAGRGVWFELEEREGWGPGAGRGPPSLRDPPGSSSAPDPPLPLPEPHFSRPAQRPLPQAVPSATSGPEGGLGLHGGAGHHPGLPVRVVAATALA